MQRRKRAHMDIQVYEDWELGAGSSTPSQPPITESTTHRHVDYVARKRGISTKTSYYSTEALSTVITDDHGHDESSTYDSVWDETTGLHRIEHDRDDDEEVTCLPRTTRKRTMAGCGCMSAIPLFRNSYGWRDELTQMLGAPAFTQSLPVEKTRFSGVPNVSTLDCSARTA
ncbi:hypothetical protein PC9H_000048 [Pleurotus ostreatus]|uniref:Uncharacterized protein n=1 Tax=Pleurotus ostreatus TaxID=5322 RepID=A0A8H7A3Z5_PLEOS|nr:uncharacterized protein PC9H_000048 [Pleurotus ostreatus]KAF7439712.1 hypothetical protein PC9H_000048 [Pleurotus ostreatus]